MEKKNSVKMPAAGGKMQKEQAVSTKPIEQA